MEADQRKYFQVVIAAFIALVLGAGVGGLVEYQRAKNSSNKPASVTTPTRPTATTRTTATGPSTDVWFGSKASSACPALKSWYGVLGTAIYTLPKDTPWDKKQETLLTLVPLADKAYRDMLPLANEDGKTELEFLLTALTQSKDAITKANSSADFLTTQTKVNTNRVINNLGILVRGATNCD